MGWLARGKCFARGSARRSGLRIMNNAIRHSAVLGVRLPARLPYPQPSSPAATAVMKANPRANTKPELRVRSLVHRAGLRFRKDYLIRAAGLRVRADLVFTRQRVAVFLDGCFWHACPDHGHVPKANRAYWGPKLEGNVRRDAMVEAALTSSGWVVLRIWEHIPPHEAASMVVAVIRGSRPR